MSPARNGRLFLTSLVLTTAWLGINNMKSLPRRLRFTQPFEGGGVSFPDEFVLEPVVDIPLPRSACFLACVRHDFNSNDLLCHFREHISKQVIGKVLIDGDNFRIKTPMVRDKVMDAGKQKDIYSWDLKSLTDGTVLGEDPRSFIYEGNVYVMNNFAKANTLMRIGANGADFETPLPIQIGKKNITPVPINGMGIMFIDFQEQNINVCMFAGDNESDVNCEPFWKDVDWRYKGRDGVNKDEWHHRGGTAGLQVGHGVYVGFGHTTHVDQATIGPHHDIWFWKLDIRGERPVVLMDHVVVDHRLDHRITDPTSLVAVGDDFYLFTAESDEYWKSKDALLINRVYRIAPNTILGQPKQ